MKINEYVVSVISDKSERTYYIEAEYYSTDTAANTVTFYVTEEGIRLIVVELVISPRHTILVRKSEA